MNKIIKIILGSPKQRFEAGEEKKNCYKCGAEAFFTDKWDWEKCKPICQSCLLKTKNIGKAKFKLDPQTLKRTMEERGLTEEEVKEVFHEIVGKARKREPILPKEYGVAG
jgi:hypothetical protein